MNEKALGEAKEVRATVSLKGGCKNNLTAIAASPQYHASRPSRTEKQPFDWARQVDGPNMRGWTALLPGEWE
jgi:hypothetical protein